MDSGSWTSEPALSSPLASSKLPLPAVDPSEHVHSCKPAESFHLYYESLLLLPRHDQPVTVFLTKKDFVPCSCIFYLFIFYLQQNSSG